MAKKLRITYILLFLVLLLTEVFIALYVRDRFVRPYVGDALVTILLCCLCRAVIPQKLPALSIYVFSFATLVEIAQYFEVIQLLGLENNRLISAIAGTTFSLIDLVCYGAGCLVFYVIERILIKKYRI